MYACIYHAHQAIANNSWRPQQLWTISCYKCAGSASFLPLLFPSFALLSCRERLEHGSHKRPSKHSKGNAAINLFCRDNKENPAIPPFTTCICIHTASACARLSASAALLSVSQSAIPCRSKCRAYLSPLLNGQLAKWPQLHDVDYLYRKGEALMKRPSWTCSSTLIWHGPETLTWARMAFSWDLGKRACIIGCSGSTSSEGTLRPE